MNTTNVHGFIIERVGAGVLNVSLDKEHGNYRGVAAVVCIGVDHVTACLCGSVVVHPPEKPLPRVQFISDYSNVTRTPSVEARDSSDVDSRECDVLLHKTFYVSVEGNFEQTDLTPSELYEKRCLQQTEGADYKGIHLTDFAFDEKLEVFLNSGETIESKDYEDDVARYAYNAEHHVLFIQGAVNVQATAINDVVVYKAGHVRALRCFDVLSMGCYVKSIGNYRNTLDFCVFRVSKDWMEKAGVRLVPTKEPEKVLKLMYNSRTAIF